jgi:polyhydroxyalkanoate synthesis regulator phasin
MPEALAARHDAPYFVRMSQIEGLKRYVEAALALGQITRTRAEELVRDLIQTGAVDNVRAQEWVEDLVSTSRERSEAFISAVRSEVRSQLSEAGITSFEELAERVERIVARGQAAARRAAEGTSRREAAPKKRPTKKKAAAKRAPAKKKAVATRAPAKKKAAAKKRAPLKKKAAAKRAPARKSASARKAGA